MPDEEPKPRVLIVDDDHGNLRLLNRALERQGYTRVATACTAQEALVELDRLVPEAMVMDLGLPPLDDRSLLHYVRRSPRWAHLPVLLLTGRQPASAIRAASQQGVSGFIQQPFDAREITYKIEQAVRGAGRRTTELADLRGADITIADRRPRPADPAI